MVKAQALPVNNIVPVQVAEAFKELTENTFGLAQGKSDIEFVKEICHILDQFDIGFPYLLAEET